METEIDAEAAVDGEAREPERDHEPAIDARAVERLRAERDALRARLIETEQELAGLPGLRTAERELDAIRASLSWRLTAPLRRVAARLETELGPRARLAVKRVLLRLAPRLLR